MKIIDFNTKNEKQKVAPIDFSDLKDARIDSDISKIVENLSVYIDRTHWSGLSNNYGQFCLVMKRIRERFIHISMRMKMANVFHAVLA